MNVACHTCQARYRIADEKVRGKIVKIRCKKCGSIVVANGSEGEGKPVCAPASAASVPRVGERHEQSVLFSLSALQRARPPGPVVTPAPEPSGLIDLRVLSQALAKPQPRPTPGDAIAHLGSGGAFAPLFIGEDETASHASPPRNRAFIALPLAATAVVALFALAHPLGVATKSSPPSSAPPIPVATIPVLAAEPVIVRESDGTSVSTPPLVASTAPPPLKRAVVATTPRPRPATSASARPSESVHRCCPGEDETTCEMRRAVGATCAPPWR